MRLHLNVLDSDLTCHRILIDRVVLSPWLCGICSHPASSRSRKVVNNCRVFATILYNVLLLMDPTLPRLRSNEVSTEAESSSILSSVVNIFKVRDTIKDDDKSEVANALLRSRSVLKNIDEEMKMYLLPPADIAVIDSMLQDAKVECVTIFTDFLNSLLDAVLRHKLEKKAKPS